MAPEELEIAKAAYCVGTIWDEYEGTEDFDHMVKLRLNHLIELVRKSQPSLPSNLDEAAWKFAMLNPDYQMNRLESFKAGAEWMAGQGVISEGKVFTSAFTSYVKTPGIEELLKDAFPEDTEVIVQVRKKQ